MKLRCPMLYGSQFMVHQITSRNISIRNKYGLSRFKDTLPCLHITSIIKSRNFRRRQTNRTAVMFAKKLKAASQLVLASSF